ncbi:uncharacterized protein Z518_07883 [Rhinocladiella mackenziei CBS 650.93]|uniref:Heterokaryon incompatibility domain-containing protein n=1 Tax=Rhinocladiella mackenziei CBS 650.93 TaxID=1442369 RepID=A0A0D2I7Y0_9EURO|nr:uncharacterized protein Z518_07883 [Rhinocladiella mackenziei CBS 650.93]KIX01944.1 hypothetical protein Z518_07883 [Rhinocladiella mackenziei CBS 650.93]
MAFLLASTLSSIISFETCRNYWLPNPFRYVVIVVCLALAAVYLNRVLWADIRGWLSRMVSEKHVCQESATQRHNGLATDYSTQGMRTDLFYDPLEEGQIRLLRFVHDVDHCDDTLRLELFHAKLSQRPEYAALSYSWGKAESTNTPMILVNNHACPVSHNLADALQKMKENHVFTLWVDAICINQNSATEKSKEVTRMFAIYRMAHTVAIWLGPDTGPRHDIETLIRMTEEFEKPSDKHQGLTHSLPENLDALERLLSQPYWSRVWIIQEVAAARQARVFWGSYVFELRTLETLVRENAHWIEERDHLHGLAQRVLDVRAACRAQQKPRLVDILAMTSASETSFLRDKVYGLLGLASDWADFIQEPNYSRGVSENQLCLEMTANYMNWYTSADIIFLRSTSLSQRTLPSWCPDYFHFEVHPFDRNLVPYVCGRDVNLGWEKRRAFGASARMNEVIPDTFRISGDRLTLKGTCIGAISALGCTLGEDGDTCRFHNEDSLSTNTVPDVGKVFRRLLLICHNEAFAHMSGSDFFTLLYTLPEKVFAHMRCMAVQEWLRLNKRFFEVFGVKLSPSAEAQGIPVKIVRGLDKFTIRPEWREYFSLSDGNTVNRRRDHPLESILKSMNSIIDERLRLIGIGDQGLLGWAHRDAAIGDTVWHLEGCTLQAILHKSTKLSEQDGVDVYHLVGHAYVDSIVASGRWLARKNKSRLVHLY